MKKVASAVSSALAVALLAAGCGGPGDAGSTEGDAVTFVVDMNAPIAQGWFDPAAERVGVRGDLAPLSWNETAEAADADGDGVYELVLRFDAVEDSLPVAFKFKVDGDANPNDGWESHRNRQLVLAGTPQEVRVAFDEAPPPLEPTFTGRIEHHPAVASAHVAARDLYVYLPPGYDDDPERRYPVLYMHDGNNIFDAASAGMEWRMDEAAQRLIPAGEVEPLIIVGVGNTPDRISEYSPTSARNRFVLPKVDGAALTGGPPEAASLTGRYELANGYQVQIVDEGGRLLAVRSPQQDTLVVEPAGGGAYRMAGEGITLHFESDPARGDVLILETEEMGGGGDAYGRMLVEEVKPFIDARYRTRPDAASTGLGGASLGGLITAYLGAKYPDVFGRLAIVSPSVWWADEHIVDVVRALNGHTGQRVWLDIGTAEGEQSVPSTRRLRDAYVDQGWVEGEDLRYVEEEGARHNETAWAGRAPDMLRFLYPASPGR